MDIGRLGHYLSITDEFRAQIVFVIVSSGMKQRQKSWMVDRLQCMGLD